jgi:phospholipid-transporting ATPase
MGSNQSNAKPSGLPKGWPNKTSPEDLQLLPRRQISVGVGHEQQFSFRTNFVTTSKYTLANFVPLFLFEEFNPKTKFANCYFLLIASLQCIPDISNTRGYPTTLLPLFIVVMVDAFFQALEDISRHNADALANASIAHRYDNSTQQFSEVKWHELNVGDFVQVKNRTTLPADVVALSVAEKTEMATGVCYVETKSLDGETNLKVRNAMATTYNKISGIPDLRSIQGKIEMEHPNNLIDSFTGVITVNGESLPILPTNILLRGTVLRNTDYILGVVVNTGHDTKIMMSNTKTQPKTSNLESKASFEIVRIVGLLATICLAGAIGATVWNSVNSMSSIWYMHWSYKPEAYFFIQYFYYFLLHATFIPVALYVSMAMVRSLQSYFMNNDLEMYYAATDTPALVRTMTLNEELGQISHVFSDKTGTLTCNLMDFRKVCE